MILQLGIPDTPPTAPWFVLFPSSCLPKTSLFYQKTKKTRVHIGMKQHAAILRSSGKMKILRISRFRSKSPFLPKTNIYEKLWVIDDGGPQSTIAPSPGSSLCSAGSSSVVRITPSVACCPGWSRENGKIKG